MNRALSSTLFCAALFFAACGPEQVAVEPPVTPAVTEEPQVATTTTDPLTGFPCDVREVLQASCAGCHAGQTYVRHLTTREELVLQPELAQSLATRLQVDAAYPMPPPTAQRQLSLAERQVVQDWLAAGLPAGECGALTP